MATAIAKGTYRNQALLGTAPLEKRRTRSIVRCFIWGSQHRSAGNDFRVTLDPVLRIQAWSLTMNSSLFTNYSGPLVALASAALFGASTPVAKLLLGVTDAPFPPGPRDNRRPL